MSAAWDQALRIQLLRWIEPNPAPLLRRLFDCGLLSQPEYFSLLETSPKANQVIALLDRVSQEPQERETFLHELRTLQEAYCTELQNWIQQNCQEEDKKKGAPLSQPDAKLSKKCHLSWKFWKHKKFKIAGKSIDKHGHRS